MIEIKESIEYFALGEFVAKTVLDGIIHPDMQPCNIGWDGQTFKFIDFANARKISMPEDLTETTVRQLTESLYPLLDGITDELTSRSYFRAGFTAVGGVLCHTIFSNTVNAGLSSFLYTSKNPAAVSFDASKIYTDNAIASAISEWRSLPLDKITLKDFGSLDTYNAAPARLKASPFNMYYLDKLYFTRCYLGLSQIREAASQLPILVMNMAVSAQHFALPYTAFGLFQKCLSMNSSYSEVMDVCANGAKHIMDAVHLNPEIIAFIKDCIHLDLFELLWILDDLDKPLPPGSHFEFSDDESIDSDENIPSNYAPFIYGGSGTAPDLSALNDGDIFYVERALIDDSVPKGTFELYVQKATEDLSAFKTLLYPEQPKPFKDFFVCSDLRVKTAGAEPDITISDFSVDMLDDLPKNIIIIGTGGIGKSMMMRHLFFEIAGNYNSDDILPIFLSLTDFRSNESSLADFLYRTINDFDSKVEFDDLETRLEEGNCIILLDGLDEIASSTVSIFEGALTSFQRKYPDNHIIISSRPTSSFIQYRRFQLVEIMPFNKDKALALIDKIEYHDKKSKEKFREDLDKKLFASHQQFASNPLLLTIMLMTYTSYGNVPAKRHIFYAKAYETMSRLHDATKGSYVRPMHTGLSPEDFSVYFAEFCARTYRKELLEFTEQSFSQEMEKTIKHQKKAISLSSRDFLLDITNNLCIMYKEGERYFFIHRSFQEYFTAVFFSSQMDDQLERICDFFENQKHRQYGDKTFDMLYDMIPNRIDRYVFLPLLDALWKKCDAEDGYWTFLEEMYPILYSSSGNPGDYSENNPQSFLYDFVANENLIRKNDLCDVEWPPSICLCDEVEWTSIITGTYIGKDGGTYCRSETVEMDSVDVDDDYIEEYGEPEVEGVTWEIDVHEVYHDSDTFSDLIAFIEADTFPLKDEYNKMRSYTEQLNEQINGKPESDDWFDKF